MTLVQQQSSQTKTEVLQRAAELLDRERSAILAANKDDLAVCPSEDEVIYDRLKVDDKKIDNMISALNIVDAAPDPTGVVISEMIRPDGLRVVNRTVPFGTILIIYEARPDVSIEAAAIALKAGNRILLKGGKEARRTNLKLTEIWHEALRLGGDDTERIRYLDISRQETQRLIAGETEKFDLVIPRGGEALIDFTVKNSKAPVMVSGRGNNFLYIDDDADIDMAAAIAINGKSRLSVCNALDKILISGKRPDLAGDVHGLAAEFRNIGVEILGDETVTEIDPGIDRVAADETWYEEFLAAKIVIGVVDGLSDAVARVNQYSGGHSASIVTKNEAAAERFMNEVDCAAVYHNASTRFTDGGEFGLGAEIAISTQKLHARGPLGAKHLTTNKWFIFGNGHTR